MVPCGPVARSEQRCRRAELRGCAPRPGRCRPTAGLAGQQGHGEPCAVVFHAWFGPAGPPSLVHRCVGGGVLRGAVGHFLHRAVHTGFHRQRRALAQIGETKLRRQPGRHQALYEGAEAKNCLNATRSAEAINRAKRHRINCQRPAPGNCSPHRLNCSMAPNGDRLERPTGAELYPSTHPARAACTAVWVSNSSPRCISSSNRCTCNACTKRHRPSGTRRLGSADGGAARRAPPEAKARQRQQEERRRAAWRAGKNERGAPARTGPTTQQHQVLPRPRHPEKSALRREQLLSAPAG